MLKKRLDREVRDALKEADWGPDDRHRMRNDDEENQYHSDSVLFLPDSGFSPPPSPRAQWGNSGKKGSAAAEKRKDEKPSLLQRQMQAGRPDRQHMPRLDTARFRKARRKNLARAQREADEVSQFRGNVSCVCTCMVLQTDKLLPFLQTQFSQAEASQPYKSQGFKSDHENAAEAEAAEAGGTEAGGDVSGFGFLAAAVAGKDAASTSAGTSDTVEVEASEADPLLGADNSEENGSTPVPRKHARRAIKGEWTFKMYTDVLHAQSTFPRDELVAVAVAEMQEGRREAKEFRRQERGKAREERARPRVRTQIDTDEECFSDDLAGGLDIEVSEEEEDKEEDDTNFASEIERAAATVADLSTKHVFCYQYGCVVFWGLEPEEEKFFLDVIRPFEEDPLSEEAQERDDMAFLYGSKTRLYNDQICLATSATLEKLSISFALAQSTKLSALELRVEETFESTRLHPQELADTGNISLSQTEVSKLIGHLFIVNSSVNLESDMLSCPDFFWENDDWEPLFRHAGKYLEIDQRVHVLNKRMEVLDGMFKMLKDQLEVRHATRLEWIVIWLIVVEVVMQLVWNILMKDILGWFNHGGD